MAWPLLTYQFGYGLCEWAVVQGSNEQVLHVAVDVEVAHILLSKLSLDSGRVSLI